MEDRERVWSLVRNYAWNSMAYLALEPDKQWFFSQNGEGVAAYALSHGVMIVCADPICPPEMMPSFLNEIKRYAARHRYRLVLLFPGERFLSVYRACGFGIASIGEEAVFDLTTWNLRGGKAAKLRATVNHAKKAGLVVKEYVPTQGRNPFIEQEFEAITNRWFSGKQTSRLQFALGDVGFDNPTDKRYLYAQAPDGRIEAFVVFLPYRGGTAYMADVTRRRPDAVYGAIQLIITQAFAKFREEGHTTASLGIAPLADVHEPWKRKGFQWECRYLYRHMNRVYGFQSLKNAKAEYAPTRWEPVYVVSRPRLLTFRMRYAMADVLDSKGFHDYVHAFFSHRHAYL